MLVQQWWPSRKEARKPQRQKTARFSRLLPSQASAFTPIYATSFKVNLSFLIAKISIFISKNLNLILVIFGSERLGFKGPTLVQAQAIPVILSGRHVLVNAATGTGKTVAYLAPVVHHLSLQQPRVQRPDGTFALVLVPTRELCLQVYEILQKLLHRFHWIVPGYVMGGEKREKEKARLRKGMWRLFAVLVIVLNFHVNHKP